jgi:serine/threonine-protein kinase
MTELITTDTAPLPKAPVVWPWIAILAFLGITAVVVIVAILSEPRIEQTPNPTPSSSENQTDTESATTSEVLAPEVVLLLRSEVIGENIADVTARLLELGLQVNAIAGELIPGDDPRARTVYAVTPTGNITIGSIIDVTYYVGDIVEPTDAPTDPASGSGEVTPGEEPTSSETAG